MTKVKVRNRKPDEATPPKLERLPPSAEEWSPSRLYKRRSAEKRRITFLELMTWAIYQAETCGSRTDFLAFERELIEVRQHEYVTRPWNGATELEPFLRHVVSMATAFTAETPAYPARRRQPIVGEGRRTDDGR
jgi:hypothetical protein